MGAWPNSMLEHLAALELLMQQKGPIVGSACAPYLDIPEGAMRVAPGSDAMVWKQCADYKAEL